MSVRRLAKDQPKDFAFTPENAAWAKTQIAKYPEGRQASAVIALLWRAQKQHGGWLPEPAIRHVAEMLDMPPIRVLEVATFYTMFNLKPVGKYFVQLCGTTPCLLRGSDDIRAVCREVIGPEGQVSADGLFSWQEVECLGACANAPMVQINEDYYEDLTPENFRQLLMDLKEGRPVTPGSQIGRQGAAPKSGPTTLHEPVARVSDAPKETKEAGETPADSADDMAGETVSDEFKPTGLAEPRDGKPDDLKRISGIGPKIEGILNELGIFHFDQIAAWTPENVAWVDGYLSFKGRIAREDWIGQAKTLASGGETDFARRYDDEAQQDGASGTEKNPEENSGGEGA